MNMMIVGCGSTTAPTSTACHVSSTRPPPAHVTQLTSSPALGQASHHVVQHHPPPAPPPREPAGYHRSIPQQPRGSGSRSRSHSARQSMHNYQSPGMMAPSPAHQYLPTSVNSPSLIPHNIPPSFLPQQPQSSPISRNQQQQLRVNSPLPPDTNIHPPNSFRKLTKPNPGNDDDVEVHDSPPNVCRRNLVSPRQRERRNIFNHVALQDHNYCAIPPPSPPRSPTPPLSPFPHPVVMGAQLQPSQGPATDNLSFGIAGYKAVGAYPSPHYAGPQVVQEASPLSRLKQTIEEAGVGPMTPLGEEESPLSGDKSNDSRPSPERDGGEETETAPEAEDEGVDDAITRCVCEFLHDDGFMICCDKCSVWQHVVCMFIDKNNIPDEYLCEKCQPRSVDKKRAKALQRAREKEIFKPVNLDSSDDEKKSTGGFKNRKPVLKKGLGLKKSGTSDKKPEKKITKRSGKRRSLKSSVSGPSLKPEVGAKKPSPRKLPRLKSASATDVETEEEPQNDSVSLRSWIDTYEEAVTNHYSPELRARLQGAKLPANHFKPKEVNGIRERCNVSLRGNGMKALTANSYIPANTPIIECRGKYMLANQLASRLRAVEFTLFHRLTSDIEVCVDSKTYGNDSRFCRRAETRNSEFNAEVKHHLDKGSLHLYIVSTKDIEKNQEIILASDNKNGILPSLSIQDEIRQIRKVNGLSEERKNRKSANVKRRLKRESVKKELCDSSSEDETPVSLRKTRSNASSLKNVSHEVKSEKAAVLSDAKPVKSVNFELKEDKDVKETGSADRPSLEVKSEKIEVEPKSGDESSKLSTSDADVKPEKKRSRKQSFPEVKSEKVLEELKIDIKEDEVVDVPGISNPNHDKSGSSEDVFSPSANSSELPGAPAKSPGKPVMGLPDQSGLIVGVNTINYDAGLKRKSKTREEKKMEMILKAIEAMERAEARKKSESGENNDRAPAKRRRSNSMKKDTADSNVDGSSGEEASAEHKERVKLAKGKRRRNISMRRRSRAKSGDSTSAMSAEEGATTPNLDSESTGTPGDMNQPFKFPFKKHNHEFHNEREDVDDVSGHYIRGSRSPPGIANHLLRSAVTNHAGLKSPTKSIGCSAKKRWLRAAMSEDHSEDHTAASPGQVAAASPGQSAATCSPGQASPEPDYTPLKKRRLATYNESTEDKGKDLQPAQQDDKSKQALVTEKINSLPNGLKKRLISNLLLEAVLDNAMQDLLPDPKDREETETGKENQEGPDNPDKPITESPIKKKLKAVKKGKGKKTDEKGEDAPGDGGVETSELNLGEKLTLDACTDEPVGEAEEKAQPPNSLEGSSHQSSAEPEGCASKEQLKEDGDASSQPSLAAEPEPEVKPPSPMLISVPVEQPSAPVQHSVFKSFFSTDLSFDDIDRQIEAKRVELARESNVSSVMSPRLESLNDEPLPRTPLLKAELKSETSPAPETPSTPSLPKKKVTIADYKRRKQASRSESVDESADQAPLVSLLTNPSILSTKVPVTTLPELPGLESRKPVPQSVAPVLDMKRTRSNSPLSFKEKTRSSPLEMKMRSGSPQLERRSQRTGSPAKVRERTISPRTPRKPSSGVVKHEKWESKSRDSSSKVRAQSSSNNRPLSSNSNRPHSSNSNRPPSSHSNRPPSSNSNRAPSSYSTAKRSRDSAVPVVSNHVPTTRRASPTPAVVYAPRPYIPTPDAPREDLTERLRKEFGLNIEESDGDGSDSDSSDRETTYPNGPAKAGAEDRSSAGQANGSSERGEWAEDYGYWNRDSIRREPSKTNSQ